MSKENYLVSFVIPIYNTNVNKFNNCIESLKHVSGFKYECVVIDDGSDEILSAQYQKICNDKGAIYWRKPNAGVSAARNDGINLSNGKYVYFLDSDDELIDNAFNNVNVVQQQYDLILSKMEVILQNHKSIKCEILDKDSEITTKRAFEAMLKDSFLNGPYCKLIKKEFLQKNCIRFKQEVKNGEDLDFFLQILACNPTIFYSNLLSYRYNYELNTRRNRVIKEPERCLNDTAIVNESILNTAKTINGLDPTKIEEQLLREHICGIFGDASNIIIFSDNGITRNQKDLYMNEMKKISISKCGRIEFPIVLKYYLVKNGMWRLISFISYLRKFYLTRKNHI